MAQLASGRLRRKLEALVVALDVPLTDTQRAILRIQLERLADDDRGIEQTEALIAGLLQPYAEQMQLLATIPGVDRWVAAAILAEVGADMSLFGGPHHLAAWAGVVPGSNQSGGRAKAAPSRKGNRFLTAALVMAANAAARTRGTYYRDKFHRLKARRGYKRATIAIARKLIIVAYHILRSKAPYRELGEHYLDQVDRHRTIRRLQRRLEELSGARVTLGPPAPSSSTPPSGAGPN
jgi:transposase